MAPKHEKGNTTGDHDAADARVRRARAVRVKLDAEGSDSRSGDGHAGPCRQALQ